MHASNTGLMEAEDYKTWACVHTPECDKIAEDDMACFKYNKVMWPSAFAPWNLANESLFPHPTGKYACKSTWPCSCPQGKTIPV